MTKRRPEFFAPGFFVTPVVVTRRTPHRDRRSQLPDARREDRPLCWSCRRIGRKVLPQVYRRGHVPPLAAGRFRDRRVGPTAGHGTRPANGGQLWIQPYPVRRAASPHQRHAGIPQCQHHLGRQAAAERQVRVNGSPQRDAARRRRGTTPAGRARRRHDRRRLEPARAADLLRQVRAAPKLQIWSMAFDGTGAQEVVANVRPGGVAVSPDGNSIVYSAERDGSAGHLAGAAATALSRAGSTEVNDPTWLTMAPDGRRVLHIVAGRRAGDLPAVNRGRRAGPRRAVFRTRRTFARRASCWSGMYRANLQSPIKIGVLDAATGKPVQHLHRGLLGRRAAAAASRGRIRTRVLFTTAERINIWKQSGYGRSARKGRRISRTCGSPATRYRLTGCCCWRAGRHCAMPC